MTAIHYHDIPRALFLVLCCGLTFGTGCGKQGGGTVPSEEYGETSVRVILEQADRLESRQEDMIGIADAMTEQAQRLREEADDLHRKEEDFRFRAQELEEQVANLRTMIGQTADTVGGVRNAATTLRAIINDEPVDISASEGDTTRAELVLYLAIALVLLFLLLRLRRRRVEREEEERLNAIRRQQAAYATTPPSAAGEPGADDGGDEGANESESDDAE